MGHNNIIELNGKQYDAITGAFLGESRIKATPEKRQAATTTPKYRGRVIDGFMRSTSAPKSAPTHAKTLHAAPKPVSPASPAKPLKAKQFDVARPQPKVVTPHKAERSQTLMRHVVRKPDVTMKPAIKPTVPTEMMARPKSDLTKQLEKKLSVTNVDPIRLTRAKQVAKSHHIRKFTPAQQAHIPVPAVKPAIAQPVAAVASPAASRPVTSATHQVHSKPAAASTAADHADTTDIFEAALAIANSHKQPKPADKHIKARSFRRRRMISALAGAGAFLVIAGFVAYLNAPTIELRMASARAGFSAVAPGYSPMGYARTTVNASEGKVVMQYQSGDSSYNITQVASDWNSQTLLDYYTDAYGAPEKTVQSEGRTIYLYNNTRAAWVNGGVRYEISGNAALNADDIVSMAASL